MNLKTLHAKLLPTAAPVIVFLCTTANVLAQDGEAAASEDSDKTIGVFESADIGESVVDPRQLDGPDVVERIMGNFGQRSDVAGRLAAGLPRVMARVWGQFEEMISEVR